MFVPRAVAVQLPELSGSSAARHSEAVELQVQPTSGKSSIGPGAKSETHPPAVYSTPQRLRTNAGSLYKVWWAAERWWARTQRN